MKKIISSSERNYRQNDQEKMEKANPYHPWGESDPCYVDLGEVSCDVFNKGYTACLKDKAEEIAELRAERDRLREALRELREYQKTNGQGFDSARLVRYAQLIDKVDELLTPQPADTQQSRVKDLETVLVIRLNYEECPECGCYLDGEHARSCSCFPIEESVKELWIKSTEPADPIKYPSSKKCPECGTVGGGGFIETDTTRYRDDLKSYVSTPCPRRGDQTEGGSL